MQLAVAYAVFITGVCIVLVIQLWLAHRRRKDVLAKLTAAQCPPTMRSDSVC